jgi:hypothetical protein
MTRRRTHEEKNWQKLSSGGVITAIAFVCEKLKSYAKQALISQFFT